MCAKFVDASRLALGFFSDFFGFPPSMKTNTPNCNPTRTGDPLENQLLIKDGVPSPLNIAIIYEISFNKYVVLSVVVALRLTRWNLNLLE